MQLAICILHTALCVATGIFPADYSTPEHHEHLDHYRRHALRWLAH